MDCDALAEFLPNCYQDNHCSGTQKCCPGRCRFKECQNTIFKKKPAIVRLGTSTRKKQNTSPAPVLLLAGGGKANELYINKAISRANHRFSKPGTCPPTKSSWVNSVCSFLTSMITTCKTDRDCLGDRKCCPGRCELQECTMPDENAANTKTKPNATVTGSAGPPVPTNKPNVTIVAIAGTKPPSNVIPPVVISKPSSRKPGTCPPEDQHWQFLCPYLRAKINDCKIDATCPEVKKCCPGRCNLNECKTPLLSRESSRPLFVQDAPDPVTDRPDRVRVPPKLASCPAVTLMPTQTPGSQLNIMNMLVCSFVYSSNPTCKQHTNCTGQTMCCKTRCGDFRCLAPVLS
ncbi:uncharacterized protein LOC135480989 [Liolophura sinensis]|uniref:uncharacterized protein LOC135480989 n=1 Tax=Liolophura sinensis TaxID=3198878 RepID=UPI0031588336